MEPTRATVALAPADSLARDGTGWLDVAAWLLGGLLAVAAFGFAMRKLQQITARMAVRRCP